MAAPTDTSTTLDLTSRAAEGSRSARRLRRTGQVPGVIYGDTGADVIDGGAGNDYLYGDGGADRLSGGDGADVLAGGPGADRLSGGDGHDHLDGQGGGDVCRTDRRDDAPVDCA